MEEKHLNIIEHLEELRWRIISCIGFFMIAFIVSFFFMRDIYKWFIHDVKFDLMVLGPSEIIGIYLVTSTIIATIFTIPIIAYQIWKFVSPGLTAKEKKVTLAYIPLLFLLFVGGLCFGYWIVMPNVLQFILSLGEGLVENSFTAEKYFRFVLNMTLPFGILFLLPAISMFLTSLNLIQPQLLKKLRKYAYFILIVIAIIITPPDFISDFLLSVPLLVLYEISIFTSSLVYKKSNRKIEIHEE